MYSTSNKYKTMVDSGFLDNDIRGKITLRKGQEIQITDKDIVPGSLSINNKAINDNDFNFGGVYVGELSVTLMTGIDRMKLNGAKLEFTYIAKYTDGTEEEIPMGIFKAYEVERSKKLISIKAYDMMTSFDKEIEESFSGELWDVLKFICKKCDMQLANTKSEINALTNAGWQVTINTEHVSTYRQALSYIGLFTGSFCTIDREGKLDIRHFSTKENQSISARRRTNSTIKDYETYYCGVKARFLAIKNFYKYTAIDDKIEDGLILDLGDIPIFLGEKESKQTIMDNLLNVVKKIRYVPADFSIVSDPSIDLGDCLTIANANNTDDSITTNVHLYNWTYHAVEKITSYGTDPHLKGVKSKDAKMMSMIESATADSTGLIVQSFTNIDRIDLGTREVNVITFNFACSKATTTLFTATIPVESSLDGLVTIRYYFDGVLEESTVMHQYIPKGGNIISLSTYIPMNSNSRKTFRITMEANAFESDSRKQAAKIISLERYINTGTYVESEVDMTAPDISIRKESVKASLFGYGLAGNAAWDGTINLTEKLSAIKANDTEFTINALDDQYTVRSKKGD